MDSLAIVSPTSEHISCLLCGTNDSIVLHELADYQTSLPGNFAFVKCKHCGLLYLNPRPSVVDIGNYYPRSYSPYSRRQPHEMPRLQRWQARYGLWKRSRVLLQRQATGRVLDVGCGFGQFLVAMQSAGWETVGLDIQSEAVEHLIHNLGIEAYQCRIEESIFPDRIFDAITFWDSLEHLHHPQDALLKAYDLLKPDGWVVLRVPSVDSLDARLFGRYWAGWDAPRHLTVFSRQTVHDFLTKAGFTVERSWCMSGSHASFILSVRFLLANKSGLAHWFRQLGILIVSNPVAKIMMAPYFYLIDRLQLGPEITILARKEIKHD
jgi:SAM-dependent methyltransferase